MPCTICIQSLTSIRTLARFAVLTPFVSFLKLQNTWIKIVHAHFPRSISSLSLFLRELRPHWREIKRFSNTFTVMAVETRIKIESQSNRLVFCTRSSQALAQIEVHPVLLAKHRHKIFDFQFENWRRDGLAPFIELRIRFHAGPNEQTRFPRLRFLCTAGQTILQALVLVSFHGVSWSK